VRREAKASHYEPLFVGSGLVPDQGYGGMVISGFEVFVPSLPENTLQQ